MVLLLRGDVHQELGDRDAAEADWTRARDVFAELGSPRAEEAQGRLDG
ncbi:hypothetical protein [Streptomyces luteolus]|uniref:Tetratricopeptide repeat protein n=1 Tax=Streptomyces luteolus TaxID=3043615 RepID=A0ABT6SPI1_9ACTN|nr:hypothetical protein [Streptomyces sp. B-S-A12]MDI3417513.1 hypothetical protein [Streptomyces sp. B-S-A12]